LGTVTAEVAGITKDNVLRVMLHVGAVMVADAVIVLPADIVNVPLRIAEELGANIWAALDNVSAVRLRLSLTLKGSQLPAVFV